MNESGMWIIFSPHMIVVSVNDAFTREACFIGKQNKSWKFRLESSLLQKPINKGKASRKIVGTKSLHLLPMKRMKRIVMNNIPNETAIDTEFVCNNSGTCGRIIFKSL
ncbi:d-alanine--d-alanine ligase [Lasius niger]|uniref:D-alanine--d-alanine ligase n=1 Tax=Lasius niger TaxID=67767 RepID=A0A0J7MZT3_LASNI|nr:d-alanine--d-alanine ligase [Lasius niger]